jgi:DNA-binding HxlR family transcriptional regulator
MEFEDRLRDRDRWAADACSAAKVLDLLSTKTIFLVVRECFYGTTRFEDFVDRVGASAPAISRALKQLESAGIVTRLPYQEPGHRARDEYKLTAAGEDLLPVFLALVQWGDTHLQNGHGPLAFVDSDSGRKVRVCVTAGSDRTLARSSDIQIRANARPTAAK